MEHDVCADDELAEGALRTFEAAGRTILVARSGGACHAVAATCPHAGGPLGEGVLRDGVVICPWHKAAFRVATGERVEPPALDDLQPFPVRVVNGLGAGDAFGGALVHGLLADWDLRRTIEFANVAGALVASRLECSTAMPTTYEVEAALTERGSAR